MMKREKISKYLYEAENVVDEIIIVMLSLGAISVAAWVLFVSSLDYSIIEFGRVIFPWVTMVALMIIGRELWLINRKFSHYLERTGE